MIISITTPPPVWYCLYTTVQTLLGYSWQQKKKWDYELSAYLMGYLLSLTEIVPLMDQTKHVKSEEIVLFTKSAAETSSTLLHNHNQTAQHSTTHSDWTPTQTQWAAQLRVTHSDPVALILRDNTTDSLLKHVRREKSKRNDAKRFVVADKIFHPDIQSSYSHHPLLFPQPHHYCSTDWLTTSLSLKSIEFFIFVFTGLSMTIRVHWAAQPPYCLPQTLLLMQR